MFLSLTKPFLYLTNYIYEFTNLKSRFDLIRIRYEFE